MLLKKNDNQYMYDKYQVKHWCVQIQIQIQIQKAFIQENTQTYVDQS